MQCFGFSPPKLLYPQLESTCGDSAAKDFKFQSFDHQENPCTRENATVQKLGLQN